MVQCRPCHGGSKENFTGDRLISIRGLASASFGVVIIRVKMENLMATGTAICYPGLKAISRKYLFVY